MTKPPTFPFNFKFKLNLYLGLLLSILHLSGTTTKADLPQQVDRKLLIMLMEYNSRREKGPLEEQAARLKFLDQFEDLWGQASMNTPVPFEQIEKVLSPHGPNSTSPGQIALSGRIRIKREMNGQTRCIEYQDGLWFRELSLNLCP